MDIRKHKSIPYLFFLLVSFCVFPSYVFPQTSPHIVGNGISCTDCHYILTSDGIIRFNVSRGAEQEALCKTCHNPDGQASSMSDVGNHVVNGGNTVISCGSCHDPHGYHQSTDPHTGITAYNLKLIRSTIQTDLVPGVISPVVFQQRPAHFAFPDDEPPYSGVCQACHTQTNFHTNDDSTTHQHKVDSDCMVCHGHGNQFSHGGDVGIGCDECHGRDADNGGTGTTQSHSTHTENDIDDLRGPYLDCNDCHDTNNFPSFASGTDDDDDGMINLSETDVCDPCHSPEGAYDGVNDSAIGAKPNWPSGVYTGNTLKIGKEKWCATCHDDFPAMSRPDGSGVPAPNVIGHEDAVTNYGIGYGYYKTGHGLTAGFYPASGVFGAGAGCLDCHNSAAFHIDGEARTYSAADNNYQEGYRLKDVNGGPPLEVPRTDWNTAVSDFALCFQCHDPDPYMDETNSNTDFRDVDNESTINRHWYHVSSGGPYRNRWDSDWDGTTGDSQINCTACHNVHGSPSPRMIRHGELISTPGTTDKIPALDFQYTPAWSYPELAFSTGGIIGSSRIGGGGGGTPSSNGVCTMCHANKITYYRDPLVIVGGNNPEAPTNVAPVDGAIDVPATPILISSEFSDADPGDVHVQSQWQITETQGDYSAPVYDSGATGDTTTHTVTSPLSSDTMYYWHVRHRDSSGLWSDYSSETSFTTIPGGSGSQTLTLYASDGGAIDSVNDPFTVWGCPDVPNDPLWEDCLDSMDDDTSFVYRCCDAPGSTLYVNIDDPDPNGVLKGATIQGVTVHVYARYVAGGPNCLESPVDGVVDIGIKSFSIETGLFLFWKGDTPLDNSGNYNLITYSYNGPLVLEHINNLQVYVKRRTSGSPRLRVTQVYLQIDYTRE